VSALADAGPAPDFAVVVAADMDNGIGKAGGLPWRLPAEMAFFKRLTSTAAPGRRNAVFMGRSTYESIAPKFRPLSDRFNLVLSRDPSYQPQGAFSLPSLDAALAFLTTLETLDRVFCAGGAQIYALSLQHPRCARIHLTRVHAQFECDTQLPAIPALFRLIAQDGPHTENGLRYTFETYDRT
jgi:dihydrofolate reductase